MKLSSLGAVSLLLSVVLVSAQARETKAGAKITKNEAEHIALKAHEGARVTSAKLQTVDGVLVWSIDIAQQDKTQVAHVLIDAKSGRLLRGKQESR